MGGSSGQQDPMTPVWQYSQLRQSGLIVPPTPADYETMIGTSRGADLQAYQIQDQDFANRFPQLSQGLKQYATKATNDMNTPDAGLSLTPGVQSQFMKAGLSNALTNLGANNLSNLENGSAGMDQVGKSLGLDLLNFQQQNTNAQQQQRQFKNAEFASALQLNPQRQIGLGGNAAAQMYLSNVANQNAYQTGIGTSLLSGMSSISSANATNSANSSNSLLGAGIGAIGSVASVAAFACWIARSAYGADNIRWVLFRHWMLNKSHPLFRASYLAFGERIAKIVSGKPTILKFIRRFMDSRIEPLIA